MKKTIVALFIIFSVAMTAIPAGAQTTETTAAKSDVVHKVVIFSLPHLTWNILKDVDTPALDSLMEKGSMATTSARTIGKTANPEPGYASMSAGDRATAALHNFSTFLSPNEIVEGDTAQRLFTDEQGSISVNNLAALAPGFELTKSRNKSGVYKSTVGIFAETLQRHGRSIGVYGNADTCVTDDNTCFSRSVAYVGTDQNGILRDGDVSRDLLISTDGSTSRIRMDMKVLAQKAQHSVENNDVTVVECSDLERIDIARSKTKRSISRKEFAAAIKKCDAMISHVMKSVSLETDNVFVVSPDTPRAQDQTTIFIAAGKKIPKGYASSSTTRREGVVTLVDITPTIVENFGITIPEKMGETVLDWRSNDLSVHERKNELARINSQAIIRDASSNAVLFFIVFMVIITLLVSLLAYARAGTLRPLARHLCLMTATIPILTFLVQPFMIAIATPLRFIVIFFVISMIIAFILSALARRYGYVRVIGAMACFNIVVLVADIFTGGDLQFMSFVGNSPVNGGRFEGWGNQVFALVVISSIVVVAMVKEMTASASALVQKRTNIALLAFMIMVLIIDGAPYFGSDVGGVLALTPTVFVVGLMLFEKKIGIKSWIIATCITLAVITTFALLDLARPVSQRTHLGRFAASIFKGKATDVIERKLVANIATLTGSYWVLVVIAGALYLAYVVLYTEKYFHRAYEHYNGFKYLVFPGIIGGVLGLALNDSGIAIPGMMMAVALPVITLLTLDIVDKKGKNVTSDAKSR